MRVLIVDDNEQLAEVTADLLWSIDHPAQYIETISFACDLETAIRLLPDHDAVICDGKFPVSQDSPLIAEEWEVVQREARRWGIHFVLYSGDARVLDDACDNCIPAISKPAAIEEIYAVLVEPMSRRTAGNDHGRVRSLAEGSTWEAKHETSP